jgi:hypothetical protein
MEEAGDESETVGNDPNPECAGVRFDESPVPSSGKFISIAIGVSRKLKLIA